MIYNKQYITVKCLPMSINMIFGSQPKPFTEVLNGLLQHLTHDMICVNVPSFLLLIVHWANKMLTNFTTWFSSDALRTLRPIEFYQRRLHCRLHSRWSDVNSSTILLFIRRIRFIYRFNALVHFHHGKQFYIIYYFYWIKSEIQCLFIIL